MSKYDLITHEFLLSILDYNPETGIFVWKVKTRTRDVGDVAGFKIQLGYIYISIKGFSFGAHRLAWFYIYKVWPTKQIDHIDCNKSNNSISNLRIASSIQQARNKKRKSNGGSGYKGVSFNVNTGKYQAYITINGKQKHLGCFDNPQHAYAKYCVYAKKYFGKFARLE